MPSPAIMIDNYDSFTYNLVQYIEEIGIQLETVRNDELKGTDVQKRAPSAIIISPGPSEPKNAGNTLEIIKYAADLNIPVLGVCLGHQSIAEVFGGKVVRAPEPVHGKTSKLINHQRGMFTSLPREFTITRYHSLLVERASLPSCFEITCETEDGQIMGIRHKEKDIEGIQFHPESILTEFGKELLGHFFKANFQ